jgi:hypothetical protein
MLFRDASQGSKFSNAGVSENDIDPPLLPDDLIETIKLILNTTMQYLQQ